ncbi:hypothetical protein R3P38DRAFT_2785220 [Favolaschia claudopus]|uniref:Uncharacterized protein n=1 Tax=Favolaschia claudopus TaxID=2862362 RepID=A0AAW0AUM7_9AGAR
MADTDHFGLCVKPSSPRCNQSQSSHRPQAPVLIKNPPEPRGDEEAVAAKQSNTCHTLHVHRLCLQPPSVYNSESLLYTTLTVLMDETLPLATGPSEHKTFLGGAFAAYQYQHQYQNPRRMRMVPRFFCDQESPECEVFSTTAAEHNFSMHLGINIEPELLWLGIACLSTRIYKNLCRVPTSTLYHAGVWDCDATANRCQRRRCTMAARASKIRSSPNAKCPGKDRESRNTGVALPPFQATLISVSASSPTCFNSTTGADEEVFFVAIRHPPSHPPSRRFERSMTPSPRVRATAFTLRIMVLLRIEDVDRLRAHTNSRALERRCANKMGFKVQRWGIR